MMNLNHFDDQGNTHMVDVTEKSITHREAIAKGKIFVSPVVLERIQSGSIQKGDVLGVARIAGIMATKKTAELIPMCHPLSINGSGIDFEINEADHFIEASCKVKIDGKTGVEMEALMGASTALLTIYDMCKALDKGMVIGEIRLVEKTGGKSGDYHLE